MNNSAFKFHVQNLSFGWCRVVMYINDKEINYNAGYLGPNPLASLINACLDLFFNDKSHITWQAEPGRLDIKLNLKENKRLFIDIIEKDDYGNPQSREWHEVIPFESFVSAIVSEGFRVLNAFGLYGYRMSWLDRTDFPLAALLRITNEVTCVSHGDSYNSDLSTEIKCLQEHISKQEITEETKMDECTIYYESWQLQCCGKPFAVGDTVEWTCVMPEEYKNAHGIIIDLVEEHHGFATHTVTGVVTRIIAERSEFPKGKREIRYEKARTIKEELKHADGWEMDLKGDETTERTFWGYIVELKDAIVKPLSKV